MPASRAADLRDALQDALGATVDLFPSQRGHRISAPAPAGSDWDRWRRVIAAMQAADNWGSSDTGEGTRIWAEVTEA